MSYTIAREGSFDNTFLTESEIIDRYVGGQLWVCGYNFTGFLGNNSTARKSSPVQTIASGNNWKYAHTSNTTSIGLKTDGTLWTWGSDTYGCLGVNTVNLSKSSPVQVITGGTNWKVICPPGYGHNLAIKTDGTLWTWGRNDVGILGDNTTAHKSSPVQTVAGGTNWKFCTTGDNSSYAIKTDGTLWTWGFNSTGQLGDNTVTNKSSPVQTVTGGTNWKNVSSGNNFAVGLKTDGTLWTWGSNSNGELGDNTTTHKSSPVQTVAGGTNWKQINCGLRSWGAIKTDGTLWVCGLNNYGQLGDNTTASKSSPIQTVAGGTNWKQVSCGRGYFAGERPGNSAIKTDGTLWVWGFNTDGQLGDNTTVHKSSPVQTVAGGTNWKHISLGTSLFATTFLDLST